MLKFNNIKQLQAEKSRIKYQQKYLEEKLLTNVKELKECLRPGNIAKDTIESIIRKETKVDEGNLFKSSIYYGISLLAKKMGGKVVDKILKNNFSHPNP